MSPIYGEMNVEDGRIPHSEQKKKFACVPPSFCIRLARDLLGGTEGGGDVENILSAIVVLLCGGGKQGGGKRKMENFFPLLVRSPASIPLLFPWTASQGEPRRLSLSPNFLPCLSNARRASASVCPEPRSSGGGEAKQHA